ncbi:MAG: putative PEP-binding protein, partial [Caldilineaceae bacterium]
DGVGLLRTEYLFQNRLDPPTLQEQYDTYSYFATQLVGRQLTIRAFDIGGDKPMPYLIHSHEANPFLGLRGIRLLLTKPELISTQYRALWRVAHTLATGAGTEIDIRFMLPMISTVEEVRAMRAVLAEVEAKERAALPASAQGVVPKIKIGVMIEVPSAALIADRIAPLVDFFSIGTNDLAQYVLATDRTNSSVAALADPLHPAVLRLIQLTCQAGAAAGIPVSICGEIGGDPAAIPLLLGLGLNELSVPVPAIPLVKEAVRRVTQVDCCTLADRALRCEGGSQVHTLLG